MRVGGGDFFSSCFSFFFSFPSKKKSILFTPPPCRHRQCFSKPPECNQNARSHTSVPLLHRWVLSFLFVFFVAKEEEIFNCGVYSTLARPPTPLLLLTPLFPSLLRFSLPSTPTQQMTTKDLNAPSQVSLSLSFSLSTSFTTHQNRKKKKQTHTPATHITPWPAPSSATPPRSRRTTACRGPCPRRSTASRAPRRGCPA